MMKSLGISSFTGRCILLSVEENEKPPFRDRDSNFSAVRRLVH
jgi:hypothetical protein